MASQPATFSISNVITNTFGLIGRNAVFFIGLSLLMIAMPQLVAVFAAAQPELSADLTELDAATVILAAVYYLTFVLLYVMLQSVFMIVSVRDLSGERVDLMQCVRQAAAKLPGLIGLFIVMALAYGAIMAMGFVPLFGYFFGRQDTAFEPGVMAIVLTFGGFIVIFVAFLLVYLMWMVAIPVKVVENVGVVGALTRSRNLTKGARLRLFGLICVFVVFSIIIAIPMGMLALFGPTVSMVVAAVSSAINAAVGAAGIAAVYIELRGAKEGTSSDQLASVFA